ncbi:Cell division protein FtsQ [Candidatus Hartigia pinicola]|nr:Cell division protein FtsQ [Candidatus Hartigia pinicola]
MSQAALNIQNHKNYNNSISRKSIRTVRGGMIFFFIVVSAIIWSGWAVITWMKDANKLPISKLILTGECYYTKNNDIRNIVLSLGKLKTFVTVDVTTIQKQISAIPWIRQVTVRKQWPDELKIHLVEYRPYASWNEHKMVDAEGRLFSLPKNKTNKNNYILLHGPPGSQKKVINTYLMIKKILFNQKLQLKSLSMTTRHSWQIILNNDIRIELGKKDILERLKRLLELYPILQKITSKQVDYIDLRYTSGAAVGWRHLERMQH